MIYMPYEEAKEKYGLPSFIPAGTPIRVIKLTANDEGCPCGGTHVNHVSEIGGI